MIWLPRGGAAGAGVVDAIFAIGTGADGAEACAPAVRGALRSPRLMAPHELMRACHIEHGR